MFSYFRWLRSGSLCPKWIIRENTGKQKYWMKAAVSNHKTHVYRRQSLVKSDYKIHIKKEANITPYLQNYLGASICCSTEDSCRQHDYGTRYGAIQASLTWPSSPTPVCIKSWSSTGTCPHTSWTYQWGAAGINYTRRP